MRDPAGWGRAPRQTKSGTNPNVNGCIAKNRPTQELRSSRNVASNAATFCAPQRDVRAWKWWHDVGVTVDPAGAGRTTERCPGSIIRDELQRLRGVVRGRTWFSHGASFVNTRTAAALAAVSKVVAGMAVTIASTGCGPLPDVPSVPRPIDLPGALTSGDSGAILARTLAPTLYLQPDEKFQLIRVVAVIHPSRPVIAYHLLWADDAHGAWVPYTNATDQEVVWVGYDSTLTPTDLWTYWHGTILHADWRGRGEPSADVQWGKHGSIPHGAAGYDPFVLDALASFYNLTWLLLPDLFLGNITRSGPWCFCHGFGRYLQFTRALPLSSKLDAIVRLEDSDPALRLIFGERYSRKRAWP